MHQQKSPHERSFSLLIILCFGLIAAHSSNAEPVDGDRAHESFRHGSRGFGPHRVFKLLHKLDVSGEQRKAIDEVLDKHRSLMHEFMSDMMDGKKALHDILTSSDYDTGQIDDLAMAQAKNTEQRFLSTARTFAEISAILTPEQRRRLADMIEKRRERREEKHREHREPM